MEGKLKALKVADLRELLQKASVPIPAKSNKADLIAKILATPAAIEVFNKQLGLGLPVAAEKPKEPEVSQDDDLLAPPEEFDWNAIPGGPKATPAPAAPAKPATPVTKPPAAAIPSAPEQDAATDMSAGTAGTTAQDDELEKRKKRAARFGIPLMEPKQKPAPAAKDGTSIKASNNGQSTLSQEQAKLDTRAARFGVPKASAGATVPAATSANQKRKTAPPNVDQEELERRKKRVERFGSGTDKKV